MMILTRIYLAIALLFALPSALPTTVYAADAVFPGASRVGLVPLEGMSPAQGFAGFQATDQRVKVAVVELPAAAFSAVESALNSDPPVGTGLKPEPFATSSGARAFFTRETTTDAGNSVRRYSLLVAGPKFSGYVAVQVPDTPSKAYSEEAVRAMLASTVTRADVPIEEQLALLPFRIGDIGNFKRARTLAPGALLLTDATDDDGEEAAPYMLIGIVATGPGRPEDRARFAQQAAAQIPGLRDARITSSEAMRIDSAPGYETRVEAVSGKDNTPVTVVQWLRFGTSTATLRLVAGAARADWPEAFTRFRAVRDSVEAK